MKNDLSKAPDCSACASLYQGADLKLRCRVNGLQARPANAADCRNYRYEPGADAAESPAHRVWYCDGIGGGC